MTYYHPKIKKGPDRFLFEYNEKPAPRPTYDFNELNRNAESSHDYWLKSRKSVPFKPDFNDDISWLIVFSPFNRISKEDENKLTSGICCEFLLDRIEIKETRQ